MGRLIQSKLPVLDMQVCPHSVILCKLTFMYHLYHGMYVDFIATRAEGAYQYPYTTKCMVQVIHVPSLCIFANRIAPQLCLTVYMYLCVYILSPFSFMEWLGLCLIMRSHWGDWSLIYSTFWLVAVSTRPTFDTQSQNGSVQISACMPVDFPYDLLYLWGQCCLHSYRPLSGSHWMPTIYAKLPPGGRQYFNGHC